MCRNIADPSKTLDKSRRFIGTSEVFNDSIKDLEESKNIVIIEFVIVNKCTEDFYLKIFFSGQSNNNEDFFQKIKQLNKILLDKTKVFKQQ